MLSFSTAGDLRFLREENLCLMDPLKIEYHMKGWEGGGISYLIYRIQTQLCFHVFPICVLVPPFRSLVATPFRSLISVSRHRAAIVACHGNRGMSHPTTATHFEA